MSKDTKLLRPPPAFQEFASDMLAKDDFVEMSLEERGLLLTMRLRCWVNGSVPSAPSALANVVQAPPEHVRRSLGPRLLSFFAEDPQGPGRLMSPELENYRQKIMDQRRQKAAAGKQGGLKTASKRRDSAEAEGQHAELSRNDVSRDEQSREASSKAPSSGLSEDQRRWIEDYDSEVF